MAAKYLYSPRYDFQLLGLQKLHKFDGGKFSKARDHFIAQHPSAEIIEPHSVASNCDLMIAHTALYLESIANSKEIAKIIEVPMTRMLPAKLLAERLIAPVRLATQATFEAAQLVLDGKADVAMNFGGGFHHAFEDRGEGFCFFADAAYAIRRLRNSGALAKDDLILMIDLDAHHGNGFFSYFANDPAVKVFDIYNFQVYPGFHDEVGDTDFMFPIQSGCSGDDYLSRLKRGLPSFLQKFKEPRMVFFNAGNDIVSGDPLGLLNVGLDEVKQRDQYVIQSLVDISAPTVVMTSGGYSKESWKMISNLASTIALNC